MGNVHRVIEVLIVVAGMVVYSGEVLVVSPKILGVPDLGLLAALIDTGATASLVAEQVYNSLPADAVQREESQYKRIRGIGGHFSCVGVHSADLGVFQWRTNDGKIPGGR